MFRETMGQVKPIKWSRLSGSIIPCLGMNHTNHNPHAHYGNNGMRGKAHSLSPEVSHSKVHIDYQKVNLRACAQDYSQMMHTMVILLSSEGIWQLGQRVNKQ
jgi:hypothetical protein